MCEEYNYSKYLLSHVHKVFFSQDREECLPFWLPEFDSTKFTETTCYRKNHAKCWRDKWKESSCPEKTHDLEMGKELLVSRVENQTWINCQPRLIHTLEHLPFWEAIDWQISLILSVLMPLTFRLGLFEITASLPISSCSGRVWHLALTHPKNHHLSICHVPPHAHLRVISTETHMVPILDLSKWSIRFLYPFCLSAFVEI